MPQPDPRRIIGMLCLSGAVVSLLLAILVTFVAGLPAISKNWQTGNAEG